jgi:acyl-CoA reductase-like NAD-dependent aldehyde dehydrogenase
VNHGSISLATRLPGNAKNWKAAAAAASFEIRPFVAGEYRTSVSTEFFQNINPADETVIGEVPVGDFADVDAAVTAARRRFDDGCWSGLAPVRRAEILLELAELIAAHRAELALLDTLEMGKPITAALFDAETFAPRLLRSWAGFADKLLGSVAPVNTGTLKFNVYEPRGVVGAITPWNFPMVNAVFKLGPALAAGNTVVLKPSELTAASALKIAELAMAAGVPAGVLNVVPGLGRTVGAALALHQDVDMLSFTGSTATGRKLIEMSGRSNGKPLLLECGGKSPTVVFDDVDDLDAVAGEVVRDLLRNSGQVCAAHTRLVVHEAVRDELLDKVVRLTAGIRPGDPLDEATTFGPLAGPAQRDRVRAYVQQGLAAGAQAVLKGEIRESGGCYVSPTIFDRVDPAMSIVREEIFGPVLCVQRFATEQEAIALANGTDFGLWATAWTRDMGRATRLAHAIKAGGLNIRTSGAEGADPGCVLGCEPQKASGFGTEHGRRGLESYSTLKQISLAGA